MDLMNDLYVEKDEDLPLEKVLADFQRAHMEILEDVEALTEAMIFESDIEGRFRGAPDGLMKL
jgi:hypothetical protein